MHEIEAEAKIVLQGMIARVRKPGRPLVNVEPMTAAERQVRRRCIQEALRVGDAHGKSREEAVSGGWGKYELDRFSANVDEGLSPTTGGGKRVSPRPATDDGKSHKVHVGGLQIGDENANRRLFAENELSKMVGEYFVSPTVNPSAHWVSRQVSNVVVQQPSPSLTLTCKVCDDVMQSTSDATDHLRVDHRKLICAWFARLNPPREFRDMGSFVTVVIPRKR
ncbi:MAG TPA: hypothetical protein VLA42_07735 [Verrucomicrobiae bacterium]|nr:hypothetical protein [Verrucomicrobiae bacterium]